MESIAKSGKASRETLNAIMECYVAIGGRSADVLATYDQFALNQRQLPDEASFTHLFAAVTSAAEVLTVHRHRHIYKHRRIDRREQYDTLSNTDENRYYNWEKLKTHKNRYYTLSNIDTNRYYTNTHTRRHTDKAHLHRHTTHKALLYMP